MNLALDEDEAPEEENGEDTFNGKEITYGDSRESLIIQWSLFAPKEQLKEDWLHTNIFHSKCIIAGNICNLIIDSGISCNVVTQVVVDKLRLKPHRYSKPYQSSWFKTCNEVTVEKKMSCSILGREVFRRVWCDVVLIDACHLLLGRP